MKSFYSFYAGKEESDAAMETANARFVELEKETASLHVALRSREQVYITYTYV